jgi:hypothetical protein
MKIYQLKNISKRGSLAAAALAIVINCFSVTAVLAKETSGGDECDAQCRRELAQAAAATARYHRESEALNDGFIATEECASVPGLGGMGVHFLNVPRTMDVTVNAGEPELLLYETTGNGNRRLVGVEYFAPVISNGVPWFGHTPTPVIDNPAPVLFGKTFDGPMPGHEPGMPWHYDLHVWIWKHNPSGLFAPFNPTVQCSE